MYRYILVLLALLTFIQSGNAVELEQYRIVDLTHAYNADTIYWPTSPSKFTKQVVSEGETPGGWYYSAYTICTPEHGGTHLDAPVHFAAEGASIDELPLENLITPAVVIDVSAQAARNRNYSLTVKDVQAFEAEHGKIKPGTAVLLRTGWSKYWPNVRAYLGDDTPGDASKLSFPGYGPDAIKLLIEERRVALIGVDTASIDIGASKDFPVHRLAGASNVPGLENLTNLAALPVTGALLIALPMKIEGGSGGPVRVVALVEK